MEENKIKYKEFVKEEIKKDTEFFKIVNQLPDPFKILYESEK